MMNYNFNKADSSLSSLVNSESFHYQHHAEQLVNATLDRGEGVLNDTGALVVKTGKFTGRSPRDKYIVRDAYTRERVHWNDFNQPLEESCFERLYERLLLDIEGKEVWVRDARVCADEAYTIPLRVITDTPWANLFALNMFLRPKEEELPDFAPEWHIYHIESFQALPEAEGVRSGNFSIIHFSRKIILIGGTGYTGEIKKGMFTVLNMLLPLENAVLSMHCSVNLGKDGDTALFFGLSGTGKTTLSADPARYLIGDDEHGWSGQGVFNFEGGCYAKCQGLSLEREPQIVKAIKPGALLENVVLFANSDEVDFNDTSLTDNTRVSYPLHYIADAVIPSVGPVPENIFFLTCDASGILPPVSKLNARQAIYHFLSGYTSKIAGTELGITDPVATFSTCFGAPFLPLHPLRYARLLADKLKESGAKVWLINTGWIGGAYGEGKRIDLSYTRAIINAVLNKQLDEADYQDHPVFGLAFPRECAGVPSALLNPALSWPDSSMYWKRAKALAIQFDQNFKKFDPVVYEEWSAGGPFTA